jgi:hypothetical protein
LDQAYLEILDVRTGDACKTGLGAIFDNADQAKRSFSAAKSLHVEKGAEEFTLNINPYGYYALDFEKPSVLEAA